MTSKEKKVTADLTKCIVYVIGGVAGFLIATWIFWVDLIRILMSE